MTSFNKSIADGSKPYWTWGPLIFTGFYFLPTIIHFNNISAVNIMAIFALFAAFIFLYSKAVYAKGNSVIPLLISMTALTALGTYFTPGTQTLFGYIAFIAGFNLSIKRSSLAIVFLWSVILITGYVFAHANVYFYAPSILISLGLFVFGSSTQRDVIHALKEAKSQEKIEQLATIAERERIARDLHDVIGHSLSSIALKSELAEKLIALNEIDKASAEIKVVAAMSREILSEVREAVSGLKQLNLSTKIKELTNELSNQGLVVETQYELSEINSTIESSLVLILTEAVTNIMRHSDANNVYIHLYEQHQNIHLSVKDNGKQTSFQKGNGLLGINERCLALNGEFIIHNEDGFNLEIVLPNGRKHD